MNKRKLRVAIDIAMSILLPILMAYQFIGELPHEWIGVTMLLLFIIHNALNWRWYKSVPKGRYTKIRVLSTLINALLLITMLLQAASGIIISKHIFISLNTADWVHYARKVHILTAYWGFIFMSVHIGLHWNMAVSAMKKRVQGQRFASILPIVLRLCAVLLCCYGCYAFAARSLGDYLMLKNQYVFFNFEEPFHYFFIDYWAIIGMFACVGYYSSKIGKVIKPGG